MNKNSIIANQEISTLQRSKKSKYIRVPRCLAQVGTVVGLTAVGAVAYLFIKNQNLITENDQLGLAFSTASSTFADEIASRERIIDQKDIIIESLHENISKLEADHSKMASNLLTLGSSLGSAKMNDLKQQKGLHIFH